MDNFKQISDLAGLSGPVTKLIETVSNGIGTLYEPRKIRENAKAESEKKLIEAKADAEYTIIMAKAEAESMKIKAEADAETQIINFKTYERLSFLELRRQQNIEKIIQTSLTQLPGKVSEEKVDEDWTVKFFNYSQDVSNEEMQLIWAQILAKEVTKPGSFSNRTLHIVNLLNKNDALLFKLFCNYLWNKTYFFMHKNLMDYYKQVGLSFFSLSHLETLGLITPADLSITFVNDENLKFSYFSREYLLSSNNKKVSHLSFRQLTSTGIEIYNLCEPEEEKNFIQTFINACEKGDSPHLKIVPL